MVPSLASASPPEFIYPIDNITVAAGREAHFTCVVNNLEGHKVAWLRSDSKAILAIHNHMVTNNPRMTVSHNGHNTWKLHIRSCYSVTHYTLLKKIHKIILWQIKVKLWCVSVWWNNSSKGMFKGLLWYCLFHFHQSLYQKWLRSLHVPDQHGAHGESDRDVGGGWGPGHSVQWDLQWHHQHGGILCQPQVWGEVGQSLSQ